ncbi:bet1-like SNARE 1-2, partial [Tanacetum coccineum]
MLTLRVQRGPEIVRYIGHVSMDNNRGSRAALFDSLEEGASSRDIDDEHENDKSLNTLQDVVFLKRLTGDIHEEVQSHNRMLDRMELVGFQQGELGLELLMVQDGLKFPILSNKDSIGLLLVSLLHL